MCAKWQWNALDWCYWIALPASPVVQSSNTVSCVSLSFRTQPCALAIISTWKAVIQCRRQPCRVKAIGLPAGSREILGRRWANVITYVGATSANDVGPTWICPSVQHWHNVVTPPTMTLCQRLANVIAYCILLYLMVGTTLAQCIMNGWLTLA